MESLGYNPNAFYELEIENDLEPEEIKEYFAKLAKNMNSYCKEHQIYYDSSKNVVQYAKNQICISRKRNRKL